MTELDSETVAVAHGWKPPNDGARRLDMAALAGIAGEWVAAVASFTEADPAGILAAYLVAAGSMIGPTPHTTTGPRRHGVNEYAVLVGPTSTGRKGDALDAGALPARHADPDWYGERVRSGFGSGEGLIRHVQDTSAEGEAQDRRLLMRESELASVLAVAGRDGSTLSGILRNAWDGVPLENHTKGQTMRATGAHVSILACITPDELRRKLTATELANGFANRFLYVSVRRSRLLPRGGAIPEALTSEHAATLRNRATSARKAGRLDFTPDGGKLWDRAYEHELSVERHGMTGAVTSRAEAHALRLSMLYALLDGARSIGREHVESALALWRYCEQSARDVWGEALGDPTADAILDAVRESGELTRTAIRDMFSRHGSGDYGRALVELVAAGRLTVRTVDTGGRPTSVYSLPSDISDRSDERQAAA